MAVSQITDTRTYLTFTLDEEDFAIDVVNVKEVLDLANITKVPRTPDFMRGVINLRGSVVPVVDMRRKFGLPDADDTVDTCIIVVEVTLDEEVTVLGALTDSVKTVFELDPANIEPPPRIGTRLDTEFISGMGKHDENFIMILDIDKVFSADELTFFMEAGESAPLAAAAAKAKKTRKAKKGKKTEEAQEPDTPPDEGEEGKSTEPETDVKSGKKPSPKKVKETAGQKAKPVAEAAV